ncbi:MAG: rRNA maturation RNase YbeY [Firmicutes bacterium]|nr:rRNA maturation RNase YbeY [Bacillota bacterium]
MEILINNDQTQYSINGFEVQIESAFQILLTLEDIREQVEVGVTFVDDVAIQSLNREYRGKDVPTDVLSFPQDDDDGFFVPEGVPRILGDIVISLPRAAEQAGDYGHSMEREVVYLAVHGLLHLLGYDHEDSQDQSIMRQREEEVMARIGLGRD